MKDYLRAAWINPYTRTGYALLSTGAAMTILGEQPVVEGIGMFTANVGLAITAVTDFGFHTLKTYNRARKNIHRYGYLRTEFKEAHVARCDKAGIKMAEQDLEKIVRHNKHNQYHQDS